MLSNKLKMTIYQLQFSNDTLRITDDRLQTIIGNRQIKNMEVSLLAKSNNKQNRTDGTITSAGIKFPTSMSNVNNPTSAYSYTDEKKIEEHAKQNKEF